MKKKVSLMLFFLSILLITACDIVPPQGIGNLSVMVAGRASDQECKDYLYTLTGPNDENEERTTESTTFMFEGLSTGLWNVCVAARNAERIVLCSEIKRCTIKPEETVELNILLSCLNLQTPDPVFSNTPMPTGAIVPTLNPTPNPTILIEPTACPTETQTAPPIIDPSLISPVAPAKPDLLKDDDTGASDCDDVTGKTNALTMTGRAPSGLTVGLMLVPEGETEGEVISAVTDGSGVWSIDISIPTDGIYDLAAFVVGLTGNTSAPSEPLRLVIDSTPPSVDAGADVTWCNTPAVLAGIATDAGSGVDGTSWTWSCVPGGIDVSFSASSSGNVTVSGMPGEEGVAIVRMEVMDLAGNPASDTLSFSWDDASPSVNAGTDIGWRKTACTLDGSAVDNGSGIDIAVWSRQSGVNVTLATPSSYSTSVCGFDNEEGTAVIRLTVADRLGNYAFDELEFRWDKKSPSAVAHDVPWTSVPKALPATVTDNGCGVDPGSALWVWESGLALTLENAASLEEAIASGSAGVEGTAVFRMSVRDFLENEASDDLVFMWDAKAPALTRFILEKKFGLRCDAFPDTITTAATEAGSGNVSMTAWAFNKNSQIFYFNGTGFSSNALIWLAFAPTYYFNAIPAYNSYVQTSIKNGILTGSGCNYYQVYLQLKDACGNETPVATFNTSYCFSIPCAN